MNTCKVCGSEYFQRGRDPQLRDDICKECELEELRIDAADLRKVECAFEAVGADLHEAIAHTLRAAKFDRELLRNEERAHDRTRERLNASIVACSCCGRKTVAGPDGHVVGWLYLHTAYQVDPHAKMEGRSVRCCADCARSYFAPPLGVHFRGAKIDPAEVTTPSRNTS